VHHATHEPGGSDALVNGAWTNVPNVFTASQAIVAHEASLDFRDTNAPAEARVMRIFNNGGPLAFIPLQDDGEPSGEGAVSIFRNGDVFVTGILEAAGLGPTPITAENLTGSVADARLSPNVLKHAGGYPGGTANFLRADGTFAAPSGGGGAADPHHATHEPGGADALVGAAWLNQRNVFTKQQTIRGTAPENGMLVLEDATGEGGIVRLTDLTAPADGKTTMIRCQGGGLSIQSVNDVGGVLGSVQWYRGGWYIDQGSFAEIPHVVIGRASSNPRLQGIDGALELLRGDKAGRVNLLAAGLGDTPLDATQLTSGIIPDARYAANVLKVAGGFPGGTANFLRADGTFAAPPAGAPAAHATTHNTGGSDPLTALAGEVLTTGFVADARLTSNVPLKNAASNVFTGSLTAVGVSLSGTLLATGGLSTTPLNATNLTTGTVPNAALASNVLRFTGGYPGGTTTFLRADGTFASPSRAFRLGHTWGLTGDVTALTTLPSIFIPLVGTQTATLVSIRTKLGSGTSVGVQVKRNGTNVGSVITVTTTAATTSLGTVALAADDELTIVLSSPVGTPSTLTATAVVEHTP
jgi:hypothetical protein